MPATASQFGRAPGAWPLPGHVVALQRRPLALLDSLPAHGDLVEIRLGPRTAPPAGTSRPTPAPQYPQPPGPSWSPGPSPSTSWPAPRQAVTRHPPEMAFRAIRAADYRDGRHSCLIYPFCLVMSDNDGTT